MEPRTSDAIEVAKDRVAAMLLERQELRGADASATPSAYWSDFCRYFDYMLEMPAKYFRGIRLHTYHLTGDNYQTYYFGGPELAKLQLAWEVLSRRAAPGYLLTEPSDGIGFYDKHGNFVSQDIIRFQRAVNSLQSRGIIAALRPSGDRVPLILEIGSGYGGLAYHLSRLVGRCSCVLLDIPETLLFAAAYLLLHEPDKSIYIYDRISFSELIADPERFESFDYVLLPNYVLPQLVSLRFQLVVNVASFQEMTSAQVAQYLDFIHQTCEGVLYSWNLDAQPRNQELSNLSQMLAERFSIVEIPDQRYARRQARIWAGVKQLVKTGWLAGRALAQRSYTEYLCRPRSDYRAASIPTATSPSKTSV
jgi:hypothetical protein